GWTWEGLKDVRAAAALPGLEGVRSQEELASAAAACFGGVDVRRTRDLIKDFRAGSMAFRPDRKGLAVGQVQVHWPRTTATLLLSDLETGGTLHQLTVECVQRMPEDGVRFDGIRSLVFSPDGRALAHGTRYGRMYLWDLTASPPRATSWQGHSNESQDLAFSPDGRSLYSRDVAFPSDGNRLLKRWEVTRDGVRQQAVFKPAERITGMALRPDGDALVCSLSHAGHKWLGPGTLKPIQGAKIPIDGRVCFSPDGRLLAVGRWEDITLFDAASGAEVRKLVDPQTGKAHE